MNQHHLPFTGGVIGVVELVATALVLRGRGTVLGGRGLVLRRTVLSKESNINVHVLDSKCACMCNNQMYLYL